MLSDWLHIAWNWIIKLLSGAGAVQVTVPQPEPVRERKTFEHVIYYIYSEGNDDPQWQESLEGGFPVAKFEYNSDGTSHLTIVDANSDYTEYIIATASLYVGDTVKSSSFNVGEIEYVENILS
jgi:hypothetical protein